MPKRSKQNTKQRSLFDKRKRPKASKGPSAAQQRRFRQWFDTKVRSKHPDDLPF